MTDLTAHIDLTDCGASPGPASALAWVLTGGEDHALAATFPPGTALPSRWTVIGDVREAPEGVGVLGAAVLVDGQAWAGPAGWDHFSG